jgi:hypothetical protein
LGPVATAGYRYRTPAVAAVTAVYRAVTTGKKNPGNGTKSLLKSPNRIEKTFKLSAGDIQIQTQVPNAVSFQESRPHKKRA